MKIVFFGTPYYVVPILEKLHKSFKEQGETPIAAVVTQSPKPTGRKQILDYSAVDTWAHKKSIPKFFDPAEIVTNKIKADIGILASYGALIPQDVIDHFNYGILVIHPSLLPQFRWASPVPAAIVTNTNPTGVSIIRMDNKWDHGPVVTQFKEEILPDDNYGTLRDRLFEKSAEVLVQMLPAYIKNKITPKPQDDSKASFARMITKEDAYITPEILKAVVDGKSGRKDWKIEFIKDYETEASPEAVWRFIRAMTPWPAAWTKIRINTEEKRLKILSAHLETGKLIPDEVQLEGKNPVSWKQFSEAYKL